ncbi:MAG: BNR-repeat neuraminidase N-terminal domain-containing protein, partial [Bacteroidota bacterium]
SGTHTWSTSIAGTVNTDNCALTSSLSPVSGMIYSYSPFVAANMAYSSSTTTQTNTSSIDPGASDQQILGFQIVTNGSLSPINAQSFTFRTTGTTNVSDITNAKVFYTGTSNSFASTTQVGSTFSSPSGSFAVTGTQALAAGTNYFWLTYSIAGGAAGGNILDATIDSMTVADTNRIPSISSPAGSRSVTQNMAFSSSTTTQSVTSPIMAGTTNQQIIGVQIVTTGSLNAVQSQSFTFSTNGSNNPSSITNAKLWSTGTSSTFAASTQVGSTSVSPSGSFSITGNTTLSEGTNYFWLAYDVSGTATSTDIFDAECSSVTVAGNTHIPSITAPSGSRSVLVPLSGTKTLGSGGDYTTFASVISDLNTIGVGVGGVTIAVSAGQTFNESSPLNLTATGTAANPILFRKSGAGANPILTIIGTASTEGGIKISGGDYITFDGIDVKNAGSSSSNWIEYGFHLFSNANDGCKHDSIKNCVVELDPATSSSIGIYSQANPTDATGAGSNSFNTVYSTTVKNAKSGIQFHNSSISFSSTPDSGNAVSGTGGIQYNYTSNFSTLVGIKLNSAQKNMSVTGQTIDIYEGGGGTTAIDLTGVGTFDISRNEIKIRTSSTMTGINMGMSTGTSTVTITRNKLHAMKTYSTVVSAVGIMMSTSSATVSATIANNMIYDIDAPSSTTSSTPNIKAFNFSTATNATVGLYHNTVLLTGATTSNANYGTTCLYVATVGSLEMKNNMFINLSTPGTSTSAVN